jgi:hypothetical protein
MGNERLRANEKALDILALSKDVDFLRWLADSGHLIAPSNLVFNTISPALTWEIFHKQKLFYSRFGTPSLKVGYPLLVSMEENEVTAIPFFIWDISLTPVDKVGVKWMFYRNVSLLPALNPMISALPCFDKLQAVIAPFLNKNGIDLDDFRAINQAVDPLFNSNDVIVPLSGADNVSIKKNEYKILNSVQLIVSKSFFELKGQQGESLYFAKNQKITLPGHSFGLQVLLPEQAAAYHKTQENTHTIIEGSAGTGKKFLLFNLVSNALSNGRSCLIISENNGFLASMNHFFSSNNLENLVLAQHEGEQLRQLIKRLTFIIQQEKNSPVFAGDNFKEILASCQRLFIKLSMAYGASRKKIFDQLDWTEVVTLFLQSVRRDEIPLVNIRIPTENFNFKPSEFYSLLSEIEPLQKRFEAINTLQHPLNVLNTSLIDLSDFEEGADQFNLLLNEERNNFRFILVEYSNGLAKYSDSLNIRLFNEIQLIIELIEELKDKFYGYFDLYGNDFIYTKSFSLLLYSKVAGRGKKIIAARQELNVLFKQLSIKIQNQKIWVFPEIPQDFGAAHLGDWMVYLEALKESAAEWQSRLPDYVNEEVLRASSANVNSFGNTKDLFVELETLMDEAIHRFNARSFFLEKLEHHSLTLIARQKWLESLVNKLDRILINFRDFPVFYQWQLSWENLSIGAKTIIQSFSTINPDDWLMTFKNWYLHQVLLRHYHHQLPDSSLPLETFEADWELFHSMLPRQIQSVWFQKRKQRIKQLRKEEKHTLQKMIGWFEKESWDEVDYLLFLKDINPLLTDCFPVVCLTVSQLNELFENSPSLHFDHIFWGDASYSSPNVLSKFQSLAPRVTYFYNPSFSNEYIDNELKQRYPVSRLSKIHCFYPGNPWQQWQGGHITIHAIKDASVHFHRINGVLQPNGINEEEASFLIDELSKIRYATPENIPSVGVVCMTETQRNFISTLIFKIQHQESALNDHFTNLVNYGLEILTPDDIQSKHFHSVYLLTTYNDVNEYLNERCFTPSYVELMAQLPLDNLSVVTSFKRAQMVEVENKDDLFIPYLKLLEAVDGRDIYSLEYEFQKFKPEFEEPFKARYPSFWSALFLKLEDKLPTHDIQKNIFFNQDFFPFFIKRKMAQSNYIFFLLDGFHANETHTDFIWEVRQTNKLKKYNIELLPIWTVNWWKNNSLEIKRLLSNINDLD